MKLAFLCIKSSNSGAGEMTQSLRACATLAEDQGLVSSAHTVPQKCLLLQLQGTRHPLLTFRGPSMWYTEPQRHLYVNNKSLKDVQVL